MNRSERNFFPQKLAIKRSADVILSVTALCFALPAMLIISILVRVDTPGPVLFRQKRLGQAGQVFEIFKFRTMIDGATKTSAGLVTYEGDPRVTRVGRLLRKLHLDELPQLLNILQGDMSFVGPRPTLPFHYDYYEDWEKVRLHMLPGLTGWSQVNGGTRIGWDRRIELDVWYVQNFSLGLDMRILAQTVWLILGRLFRKQATQTAASESTWSRGISDDPYSNDVSRARKVRQ